MTQPTHLIADVYAVKVPEGAKDFELEIDADEDWYYLIYFLMIDDEDSGFYGEDQQHSVELPPGAWEIIGSAKEVTEEQAHQIVESVTTANELPVYRDYEFSTWMKTAVGSLRSLLTSKGLDPNKNYVLIKKVS